MTLWRLLICVHACFPVFCFCVCVCVCACLGVRTCSLPACHGGVRRDVSEAGAGAGPPAARRSRRPPGAGPQNALSLRWRLETVRGGRSLRGKGARVSQLTFEQLHTRTRPGRGWGPHTPCAVTHTPPLSECSWCGGTGEGLSILCFHTDDTWGNHTHTQDKSRHTLMHPQFT